MSPKEHSDIEIAPYTLVRFIVGDPRGKAVRNAYFELVTKDIAEKKAYYKYGKGKRIRGALLMIGVISSLAGYSMFGEFMSSDCIVLYV